MFHVTLKENFESIMLSGLIPQVGERSMQLGEKPGVFLFPTEEDMDTALGQWLGDEYEEEDELFALKVTLKDDFHLEEPVEFERVARSIIEPNCIEFYKEA